MTTLKVENLAIHTSTFTLKQVFKDYGPVGDVYIPQNPVTKEPYGFAFIHFYNSRDAKNAMDALNGTLLDGCKLKVQMVHNDDPQYAQPHCGHGGQHHYEEENHDHEFQSERHCCRTTRIQSRSHSGSSPGNSECLSQSRYHSQRRSSSIKRGKMESSVSTPQLRGRPLARTRSLQQVKKKFKSKSLFKGASKYPSEGRVI